MCLTLTEMVSVESPVFVFEFLNEFNVNAIPIIWTPTNISEHTGRFDLFQLDEPADLDLKAGQYSYAVKVEGLVIEEGRMIVELDNQINDIYL